MNPTEPVSDPPAPIVPPLPTRPGADLAIVGASFAGLACAHAAAARGLRTVVLEKKPEAGAYPHTTGILVKEVADEWDVPRRLLRKIRRVRLYGPSLQFVDLVRPGYAFYATDTAELMRWWAREAERMGAEIRYATPFSRAERSHQGLRLGALEARYVVGADGPKSRVADALGFGRNESFLRGVEAEFKGLRGLDPDCLHVFLDRANAPGYIAWVVPGVEVAQVGLAARMPHAPRLEPFLERIETLFDFREARIAAHRGGLIPVGGPVSPLGDDRAALVGDAAGFVSPLTAGGIHTALQSGRRAGLAICDHLLDDGPSPVALLERDAPRFRAKRILRRVYDHAPSDRIFDLALGNPLFRRIAATVFFHHRGLLSKEAWRDLLVSRC